MKNLKGKIMAAVGGGLGASALACVSAFAEAPTVTYYTVDATTFNSLFENVSANISTLMPVGIAMLGVFLGAGYVFRVIRTIL